MKNRTSFIKGQKRLNQGKRGNGKVTVHFKKAIEQAFDELGGSDYLVMIGKKYPAIFCQLIGKVIPHTIKTDLEADTDPIRKIKIIKVTCTERPKDSIGYVKNGTEKVV